MTTYNNDIKLKDLEEGVLYWFDNGQGYSDTVGLGYIEDNLVQVWANGEGSTTNYLVNELPEIRVVMGMKDGEVDITELYKVLEDVEWHAEVINLSERDYEFILQELDSSDEDDESLEGIFGESNKSLLDIFYRKDLNTEITVEELENYLVELRNIVLMGRYGETNFSEPVKHGTVDYF